MDGLEEARWVTVSPDGTHVYVAGSAGAPAIIPECVAQGGAAAAEAAVHVLDHRLDVEQAPTPETRDPHGEPRVGVFVCHCGANIAGVVDVEQLAREATELPHVVHADQSPRDLL